MNISAWSIRLLPWAEPCTRVHRRYGKRGGFIRTCRQQRRKTVAGTVITLSVTRSDH